MTTNLGSKIIERKVVLNLKTDQGGKGFKITPDAVIGWEYRNQLRIQNFSNV
jgi:hypothetical protein